MEFVVAEVEGGIDRFEWFKVDIDSSLFTLRGNDFSTIYNEPIRRNLIVEFETLLGRSDR